MIGLAEWVIIIAAVVAIVLIACRAMGVTIPPWVVQIGWVVVIALVALWAIHIIAGYMGSPMLR